MSKLYNTQAFISTSFANFLSSSIPNIRKTQLNIIPYIIFGMISSESAVASDIAKHLKDNFSLVQFDSVIKRIKRLFVNKLFDPYDFYDQIIRYVISKYKTKHPDRRVHITFDHMFSHSNYTVFMISMRIGKQGIPLWFRCFDSKSNSDAFREDLLFDGISYVSSLFDSSFDLIFLADRWFNSFNLLDHIDSLGHTFCIRLKRNIKILHFDKKEGHYVWKFLEHIDHYKYHSFFLRDVTISDNLYKANLAFSKTKDINDPWIIITNGNPARAIKDYSYRFGAVESLFKNQKSNGFHIESTVNASIKYFTSMYTLVCVAGLYLTIVGADYTKNSKCYRNVKLPTHKIFIENESRVKKRTMSLFSVGLTLFQLAFNSSRYIRLPFTFTLYDI